MAQWWHNAAQYLDKQGISSAHIARILQLTKNQVVGHLDREFQKMYGTSTDKDKRTSKPKRGEAGYDGPTMEDRIQALHDKMNALLRESKNVPRLGTPVKRKGEAERVAPVHSRFT